uniref:Transmembrane protein n=1 Tax=Medicago truncatula TaxID=3880 RepID=I3S3U4_MEDTR|nr:unknown [Medicago truncatula]
MFTVALLTLRKTPLKICLKRKSCKIFLDFGSIALIPLILIMNKSLASGST